MPKPISRRQALIGFSSTLLLPAACSKPEGPSDSSITFAHGVASYAHRPHDSRLGVQNQTREEHGAVSEQVVEELAKGVLGLSGADSALSVSGIAGPDGGTDEKPVGTVWFAWAVRDGAHALVDTSCELFSGDRDLVRELTVAHALQGVLERIEA
mgnify:CR=1 FL=1